MSLATVDRVLNERPGVRSVTIKKVQAAIDQLGYVRDTAAANLARRRVYRLLFILPDTNSEFVLSLRDQIQEQADKLANDRTELSLVLVSPFQTQDVVVTLDGLDATATDGIALLSPETPSIRDAIKRVRDKGIAVVTLVSDLPSSERNHFVGVDNISAGRTAAQLMGRFVRRPGKILFITGSRKARAVSSSPSSGCTSTRRPSVSYIPGLNWIVTWAGVSSRWYRGTSRPARCGPSKGNRLVPNVTRSRSTWHDCAGF